MAVFKVLRNREYQDDEYMYRTVEAVWNDTRNLRKYQRGVPAATAKDICGSFNYVQQVLGKNILVVKIHCFSIEFESFIEQYIVERSIHKILDYLSREFQVIATLKQTRKEEREAVFIINAVSPATRRCFHDNNRQYQNLITILGSLLGSDVKFEISNGTFFKPYEDKAQEYQN